MPKSAILAMSEPRESGKSMPQVAAAVADKFGVPYGFSVHALDARKVPKDELGDRARRAAFAAHLGTAMLLSPPGIPLKPALTGVPTDAGTIELDPSGGCQ